MASLNSIADYIIGKLGADLDFVQRQKAKFAIKFWRAKLIRQDIERNGGSPLYIQRFTTPLVKVDSADSCIVTTGDLILKSKDPIPKPVRTKADEPFNYVGVAGNGQAWTYASAEEIPYTKFNKYTANIIRYSYIDGHVYIHGNCLVKYVTVESVFEDPSAAGDLCVSSVDCFDDDKEFPIGIDMLEALIAGILGKGNLEIPESEVTIESANPQQ